MLQVPMPGSIDVLLDVANEDELNLTSQFTSGLTPFG